MPDRAGQRGGELTQTVEFEVAEAVAEAHHGVELVVPRDCPHVGVDEFDIEIGSGLPGVPDRFGGQVDAGHGVPAAGELEAVPPAAARHVQDPRARRETEPFLDEIDLFDGDFRRHGAPTELVGQFDEEVHVPGGRGYSGHGKAPCGASASGAMTPGDPGARRPWCGGPV